MDGQLSWQLEVQLVHVEAGSRIVLVQLRRAGQILDSALGEAATAELAEDRARQRLQGRPQPQIELEAMESLAREKVARGPVARQKAPAPIATPAPLPLPSPTQPSQPESWQPPAQPPEEPQVDPEDWSTELAQLELELQRLGWDRDQEAVYLQRVFGNPNRNRLTNYADLQAYLAALQGFSPGTQASSAPAPLRRRELLSQCDQLLAQLQWEPGQGRALLERHFSLTSRQQLSDAQLLQFNMLLEDLSSDLSSGLAPTGPPG
ncbi:hypothetical protein H8F27_15035 [Synechococcus sp. CBW1108]|nr:hypothetical protein H8F27_15035 [Synechococcus sp. CBW1108]